MIVEKLIFSIFTIIIIMACIFAFMVIMVKLIKQNSFNDAIEIVESWWERFFTMLEEYSKKTQSPMQFPVLIGANGYSIRDEIVNNAFKNLYKFWEIYFYTTTYPYSSNVIIYEFKVYNSLSDIMDNRRLRMRAKEVSEAALTKHLHDQGVYDFLIDNFIFVSLNADTLRVHIATNPNGFEEIAMLRQSNP